MSSPPRTPSPSFAAEEIVVPASNKGHLRADESPGIRTVGSDFTAQSTPVTIKHEITTVDTSSRGRQPRSVGSFLLNKWAIAGMAVMLIAATGGGIWSWLQIPGLNSQIEELEKQVNRLETEIDRLETQNDRYEVLNSQLNKTAAELEETNTELQFTADRLELSVDNLNNTVLNLEQVNRDLAAENVRYAELNAELNTILDFLNETAENLNESYEAIVSFLAEQITANRVLLLLSLENTYDQQIMNWDCAFRDVFRGQAFIADEDIPIGDGLPAVLAHVEEEILSEICIDTDDFETYLNARYSLDSMTVNQLYQGVAVYVLAVMNYYFPDDEEPGLTPEDWARADYRCANVMSFSFFA